MKRAPFEPESEYRVIFEEKGKPRSFVDIEIPLSCIERIYLSPWMPKSVAESVKAAVKRIEGAENIEVARSTLIQNDRWENFGKIGSRRSRRRDPLPSLDQDKEMKAPRQELVERNYGSVR